MMGALVNRERQCNKFCICLVQTGLPQSILKHLRWLIQKDVLGQDMFLIGPPGPMRRKVAMMYSVSWTDWYHRYLVFLCHLVFVFCVVV